ncbi:MAG: hypothetical protein ABW104_16035 [Candidatus Thiodiazotropha sp. 6PLUC2]
MKFVRIFFLLLVSSVSTVVMALPTARITIKVMDESGLPVEEAKAGLVLEVAKKGGEGWGTNTSWVSGLTDADGLFTGEGETAGYVGLSVKKDGYYDVSSHFNGFTDTSGFLGFKKYKPWNPTVELVLKKKLNPIAMYAHPLNVVERGAKPEIPMLGRFVGFDLVVGDWVAPYGLGVNKDFLIKVDVNRAVSFQDHDVILTIQFPNEGDGLIQYFPDTSKGKSALRLPYHAPSSGYLPEFTRRYENKPGTRRVGESGDPEYDKNYFFRIRTQLDKQGNVISGRYGKIHGSINLYNYSLRRKQNNPFVAFNYYLNPNDNDTNIEFDPGKNLFINLQEQQKVRDP